MSFFNIEFVCDDCESMVEVDIKQTTDSYARNLDLRIIGDNEQIDVSSLPNYLVYKCTSCYKIYKLTLADVEQRLRLQAAKLALDYRRSRVFARNRDHMDIDSGLEFCGLCGGIDESRSGYCIKSLMDVCDIRRDHIDRNINAK